MDFGRVQFSLAPRSIPTNKGVSVETVATAEEIVAKARFALTNMIGSGIIDLTKLKTILEGK